MLSVLKIANARLLFVTNRVGMLFPVKLYIEDNKIIELRHSLLGSAVQSLMKFATVALSQRVCLSFRSDLVLVCYSSTTVRLVWGLFLDFLWWCWHRTQFNTSLCHRYTYLIAECSKHWGRSIMPITNSNGHSKEPRGTTKSRGRLDDNSFPYWTVCEWVVRKFLNQVRLHPVTPQCSHERGSGDQQMHRPFGVQRRRTHTDRVVFTKITLEGFMRFRALAPGWLYGTNSLDLLCKCFLGHLELKTPIFFCAITPC